MASCSASSLIARTGQPLNSMIFSENSVGFISFGPRVMMNWLKATAQAETLAAAPLSTGAPTRLPHSVQEPS
jgi:hypothetical protein